MLIEVELFEFATGQRIIKSASELGFHYRESLLKTNTEYFIVSATFDLEKVFPDNIYMSKDPEEMQQIRRSKQPPGLSCGSYFRNPP